ncbi:hypothetical protein ACGC1H_003097 [Rhizoctonia solani]
MMRNLSNTTSPLTRSLSPPSMRWEDVQLESSVERIPSPSSISSIASSMTSRRSSFQSARLPLPPIESGHTSHPTKDETGSANAELQGPRKAPALQDLRHIPWTDRGGTLELSTRKVGDKGTPRLLCLDGSGGVRGLSSLLLLKEFLYRVVKHKKFTGDGTGKILPCEYFDMICGTGTGGLIAIMLGKLRMTVDEAIDKYLELSRHIFAQKKWIWKEGRYSARNLEFIVKNIVGERALLLKLPGYDLHSTSLEDRGKRIMMRESKSDPKLCKVFVCARQVNDSCEELLVRRLPPLTSSSH